MSELLITEISAGVATLTLNRVQVRNALNTELLQQIAGVLRAADNDPGVQVALLRGQDGHFAAGADIGEIAHKSSAEGREDPRKSAWAEIRAFRKPLIAGVEGFCLGGGCELALIADLMVIDPGARLGQPETNLGLIPGAGGGQRLLALAGRARAMRLVLTGEIISGETAWDWGIASHLAEPGAAPAEALALAAGLAKRAPLALAAAKAAILTGAEAPLTPGFEAERRGFEVLLDTSDKAEGITAFREKRAPRFTGT